MARKETERERERERERRLIKSLKAARCRFVAALGWNRSM
jgi:hypothetical protein